MTDQQKEKGRRNEATNVLVFKVKTLKQKDGLEWPSQSADLNLAGNLLLVDVYRRSLGGELRKIPCRFTSASHFSYCFICSVT